jgi:hypothetical protein
MIMEKKTMSPEREGNFELLGKALAEMAKSPAMNEIAAEAMRNILSGWSGDSFLKQKIADRIVAMAGDLQGPPVGDADIWSDERTMPALITGLSMAVNAVTVCLLKMESAMSRMSPREQIDVIRGALEQVDFGRIGRLLTQVAKNVSALEIEEPAALAAMLEKPFAEFLRNTDFGELKETLDHSADGIVALAGMAGQTLWDFPGKLACIEIMSMTLTNIGVRAVRAMLKPMENASPESMADLIFAVVDSFDGRQMGAVVNALAELLRKIHTGSVILGEGGKSVFQAVVTKKWKEILSELDPVLVRKAAIALAQNREAAAAAKAEAVREHPEVFLETLSAYSALRNPALRAAGRRLRLLEDFPEDELDERISEGLADLDVQEMGEMLNSVVRLANRIRASRPGITARHLAALSAILDGEELERAADWIAGDVAAGLKPVIRGAMPALLRGLSEILTPGPGEDNTEIDKALSLLTSRMTKKGGR